MDLGIEEKDITRPDKVRKARGKPGKKPTWSSGAKDIVGVAATPRARVRYTVGNGTLNEIYFGDIEQANTRSVRFLVTDGGGFFADEACDAEHTVTAEAGVPTCRIETRCKRGRFRIVKEIVTDPVHDTVVMRAEFLAEDPSLKLYLTIDPHMGDQGEANNAWAGAYKGRPVLVAHRVAVALAVCCSAPMEQVSVGYSGKSDGCTMLQKGSALPDANLAEEGTVELTAQIGYGANSGTFLVAIGFGTNAPEAAQEATSGILQDFDLLRGHFVHLWKQEQALYKPVEDLSDHSLDMYRVSTAVMETHHSSRFPGGFVASLSIPWGFACSDADTTGYHVLWPRDIVEIAMGKLACGDALAARSSLHYLRCVQESNGGWSQNFFLDGTPYWTAAQMDGTALPVLLADALHRENALDGYDPVDLVEGALRFLLAYGPVTEQDRWESLPGYSPYTIATQVAALLAGAGYLERRGDHARAAFLRETADAWHDCIDEYTYVEDTELAREHGVSGYYIRIAPPKRAERRTLGALTNRMPNIPLFERHQLARNIVSPDALALVRFGMRAADDPRIVDTVKVIDATLRRETKTGHTWARSSKDGYGEAADGTAFGKTGIGRGWPLLTGERAHYEVARGNRSYALELLNTIAKQSSSCGMIPEQVWDAEDIPERFLFNGRPSGSAMPLVWAHAEYVKLLRSLSANEIWDRPPDAVKRYQDEARSAAFQIWTPSQRRGWMKAGKELRIDLPQPATVEWQQRDQTVAINTQDSGFGVHTVTLPTSNAPAGTKVNVHVTPAVDSGHLKEQKFVVQVH